MTAEAIGSHGTDGVRNGRFIFGLVRRSTTTAIATTRKANSVPMLTISASVLSGTNAPSTQTTAVVPSVIRNGVWNRSCTCPTAGGSSPSRHSAKPIRPIATMSTRITELSPQIAAMLISTEAQPRPTWSNASEIGAPSERSV